MPYWDIWSIKTDHNPVCSMQMHVNWCIFPPTLSTEAVRMSIWRKISFWPIHPVLALRPSLTCERWAHGFVFPLESTSSSPPPLSHRRRLTLSSGSSLRSNQKQSMCLSFACNFNIMDVYGFALCRNLKPHANIFFCLLQRNGWHNLCWFRRWSMYQWDMRNTVGIGCAVYYYYYIWMVGTLYWWFLTGWSYWRRHRRLF